MEENKNRQYFDSSQAVQTTFIEKLAFEECHGRTAKSNNVKRPGGSIEMARIMASLLLYNLSLRVQFRGRRRRRCSGWVTNESDVRPIPIIS